MALSNDHAAAAARPTSSESPEHRDQGSGPAAPREPQLATPARDAAAPTRAPRALGIVAAAALATYATVDLALQRLQPLPPRLVEVADGVAAYAAGDPDLLILGSSHARSFLPLARTLGAGGQRAVVVPAEWGTFTAYRAVLLDRLRPLIEERDQRGQLVRPSLSRALLVTTVYDLCTISKDNVSNLPARVWGMPQFVADVRRNGLTDYNRNFLQTRWRDLFGWSLLVQDRGHGNLLLAVGDLVHPGDPVRERTSRIARARQVLEAQWNYCDDPLQKQHLRAILAYLTGRQVEVGLVLFPLMPSIVTERARRTTLARYRRYVDTLASEFPLRVIDLTFGTPMRDADFQADLDHATPAANEWLSRWLLQHDLAYLSGTARRAPAARSSTPTSRGG
jgi:hypothetical protein